jgi:hypothetical protein
MTELLLHGLSAGEDAQIRAVEAGTKQLVDRGLEGAVFVKNPHRLVR